MANKSLPQSFASPIIYFTNEAIFLYSPPRSWRGLGRRGRGLERGIITNVIASLSA